jgi:hypothetical protein
VMDTVALSGDGERFAGAAGVVDMRASLRHKFSVNENGPCLRHEPLFQDCERKSGKAREIVKKIGEIPEMGKSSESCGKPEGRNNRSPARECREGSSCRVRVC